MGTFSGSTSMIASSFSPYRTGKSQPLTCVSSDGHCGQFNEDVSEWMDPKFRGEYQEIRKFMLQAMGNEDGTFDFQKIIKSISKSMDVGDFLDAAGADHLIVEQVAERRAFLQQHFGDEGKVGSLTTGGEVDPHRMLQEIEADGTVGTIALAQVGTEGFFLGQMMKPELRKAITDASNRWSVDFMSQNPAHFAATFNISADVSVEAAVEQIRWARKNGLRGGIQMLATPDARQLPLYSARFWEPIWEVCADLGVVFNIHGDAGQTIPLANGSAIWTMELPFWHSRALKFLVMSGVFERHPRLKVAMIETSTANRTMMDDIRLMDLYYADDWTGKEDLVERMPCFSSSQDWSKGVHRKAVRETTRALLKKPPSEYVRSNVWFAITDVDFDWSDKFRNFIGADRLMWGSDYPHNEGIWPHSMQSVARQIEKNRIPEEDVRKLMGLNAAKLWEFDLEKLRPAALQYGPAFH